MTPDLRDGVGGSVDDHEGMWDGSVGCIVSVRASRQTKAICMVKVIIVLLKSHEWHPYQLK